MYFFGTQTTASCNSAEKATAPLVTQSALTIAPGAGSTAAVVFTGVAADPAPMAAL